MQQKSFCLKLFPPQLFIDQTSMPIYELAVICKLALNEALGMKRIFSIIME